MNILAFEDTHFEVLETLLYGLFMGATIHMETEHQQMALDIEGPKADIIITDMMMPTTKKSRTRQPYAGVSVMLWAHENDVPAVCLSSNHHHDNHVNFGNHLLRQIGVEMVDCVEKDSLDGWLDGLKNSFGGHNDHWTTKPKTSVRSTIQESTIDLLPNT